MLPADFSDWFENNLRPQVKPSSTIEELNALATVNTPFSLSVQAELAMIRTFLMKQLKAAKRDEQVRLEQEREARIFDGALQLLRTDGYVVVFTGADLVVARDRFLSAKQSTPRVRAPSKVEFELLRPLLGKLEITHQDLAEAGITVDDSASKALRDYMYHHGYKSVRLNGSQSFRKREAVQPQAKGVKQKGKKSPKLTNDQVLEIRYLWLWGGLEAQELAERFGRVDARAIDKFCRNEKARFNHVGYRRPDGRVVIVPHDKPWDRASLRRYVSTH
jgi:hypothetical protein